MENLVNLCLEQFVESIQSSAVSRDGYPVQNLTSVDPQTHSKGYCVEHFIRPPVSIVITFKYPVHIASILFKPSLEKDCEIRVSIDGSHLAEGSASTGYSYPLHSGCVARGPHALLHFTNKSFDRKWERGIAISRESVTMVRGSRIRADGTDYLQPIEQPLRNINILSRLKQLRVTVTRLTGVKPFALKWIEAWGVLSSSCSQSERDAFQTAVCELQKYTSELDKPRINLFSHHNCHHSNHSTSPESARAVETSERNPSNAQRRECDTTRSPTGYVDRTGSENRDHLKPVCDVAPDRAHRKREVSLPEASVSTKRQRMKESSLAVGSTKPLTLTNHTRDLSQQTQYPNTRNHTSTGMLGQNTPLIDDSNDMPDKFLDAITYEMMLLPMVLPSGYVVDRSTIDKLASNDAMYGRPPTDPFTGVAFTELSKPQFSPEMKVLIDEFLSNKRNQSFSEPSHSMASQKTVGNASQISSHLESISTSPNERAHPVSEGSTSCGINTEGAPFTQRVPLNRGGYDDSCHLSMVTAPQRKPVHLTRGVKNVKDGSFENRVSCSLDAALSQLFSHN